MDLVEILKECGNGYRMYSPVCGTCTLKRIDTEAIYPIVVTAVDGCEFSFTEEGKLYTDKCYDGECIIFPDKNMSWEDAILNSKLSIIASLEKVSHLEIKSKENKVDVITGFRNFKHVEEIAKKYNLKTVSLYRPSEDAPMQISAYGVQNPIEIDCALYSAYDNDRQNVYKNYINTKISEYDFIDYNVNPILKRCETFEELAFVIFNFKVIYNKLKDMKEDEILITKNNKLIDICKKKETSFHFNGYSIMIGLIR